MIKIFKNAYLRLLIICITVAITTSYFLSVRYTDMKITKNHTEKTSVAQNTDLKSIESVDFEMNMEKMEVVLIKRSILDSDEVTIIELANGRTQTIVCSRDIHDRLVEKFRRILLKRNNGF